MDIDNPSSLEHELPNQTIRYSLVDVAYIDSGLLVLLPKFILLPLCLDDKNREMGTYQCRAPDIVVVLRVELLERCRRESREALSFRKKVSLRGGTLRS